MAIPTNRTPVRIARGAAVKFTETIDGVAGAGAKELQDGEIIWDETNEKFQIKYGGSTSTTLKDHTVDTSGFADLTGADFTGPINVGADQAGEDVKFFGAGAGKYCLWDENQNRLEIEGGLQVNANDTATFKGQTTIEGQVNFTDTSGNSLIVGDGTGFYQTVGGNNPTQPVLMLDYDTFEAYYQGDLKLKTTLTGVDVTGILTVSGTAHFGAASNTSITSSSDGSGGYHTMLENSSTGDLYLRGTEFYLQDNGTAGNPEWMHCLPGAGVELSHGGNKKFETTADGVIITGNLTVGGTTTEINTQTLTVDDHNIELGSVVQQTGQTATLALNTNVVTVASTEGYLVNALLNQTSPAGQGNGDFYNSTAVYIGEINSATEFTVVNTSGADADHIGDGPITFTVGGASDLTADGGGLILKNGVSDKTILWTNSGQKWNFNEKIEVAGTVSDSNGDVRKIPQHAQVAATTMPVEWAGKHIEYTPTAAIDLTVNTSIFSAGDAVTIVNNSTHVITIKQGTATIHNSADASTGDRALAGRGMATLLFTAANTCYISGAGLS